MVQTWPGAVESVALARWADSAVSEAADPDAVRRFRTDYRLTTAAVCRAVGISAGTLHRFEHGLSRPRKATLRALADVYGVTPRALRRAWRQSRAAAAERLAQMNRDRRRAANPAPGSDQKDELLRIAHASTHAPNR